MKKAFLVVGPESSGTRMMTKAMISAGCSGSNGHKQPWDSALPSSQDLVVWRRSLPHNREWPQIESMAKSLRAAGYYVIFIVIVRDWGCMAQSQVNAKHVKDLTAADINIRRAYVLIFSQVAKWPFVVVTYEQFCRFPDETLKGICDRFGLEAPKEPFQAYDGNEKYMGAKNEDTAH